MKKWVMTLATVLVFGAVLASTATETTTENVAWYEGGPVQTAPVRG